MKGQPQAVAVATPQVESQPQVVTGTVVSQMQPQPVVAMAPAPQAQTVSVTAAGPPGTPMMIAASGQTMSVVVPPGIAQGQAFFVQIPSALPMQPMQPMQPATVTSNAPPGAPPGGNRIVEKYCGMITILVGLFIVPCVCCCPCDERHVYIAPDGSRYDANSGARLPGMGAQHGGC
mmetsp:Transcript_4229/g.10917  ORF Transcript_4229/g.10917 Transcript_4229/m.10917 type:complete len:176 (+) Transcript_4229:68-595(+)